VLKVVAAGATSTRKRRRYWRCYVRRGVETGAACRSTWRSYGESLDRCPVVLRSCRRRMRELASVVARVGRVAWVVAVV